MLIPSHLLPARDQVIELAIACPDEEICGLIIDGVVVPSENCANGFQETSEGQTVRSPANSFELDSNTFDLFSKAIAAGKEVVVYHSHVNGERDFTGSDVTGMKATQCPWLLVHTPSKHIEYHDITITQPYEGRQWHWGYNNCATLVQDWLKREMGFSLHVPALTHDNAWAEGSWDEFRKWEYQLEKVGRDFSDLRRGDIVLMRVGSARNPCHVGVIVSPERNEMLHQLCNQLSCVKQFDAAQRKSVWAIYRVPKNA